MKERPGPPRITSGVLVVTIHDQEIFKTREDAEKLARANQTQVEKYTHEEHGITQVVLPNPYVEITLPGHRERRHGSTEFIFDMGPYMGPYIQPLGKKMESAALLLEQGMRLHQERQKENRVQEEILLRTVHNMTSDRTPSGHPEEQTQEPISVMFLTPSGRHCLNKITWERDRELEETIREEDDEDPSPQYEYRSENITRIPPTLSKEEFLEIIRTTYITAVRFLLGNPGERQTPKDPDP